MREGYHGMAFVVAFKHPCSSDKQKALNHLARLPGSLRSMVSYDYSIEYCHIYTNESIGDKHAQSIKRLNSVTKKLDAKVSTYSRCIMVDDYTHPDQTFDYMKFLEWTGTNNATPHFLTREADLIPSADEVYHLMKECRRKRTLRSYIHQKKYPCSIFIAAWYLARLGKLETVPQGITSHANRLINILPIVYEPFEREAFEIIAMTPFKYCLDLIRTANDMKRL